MKMKALRELSVPDLKQQLAELAQEKAKLGIQNGSRQLKKTDLIKKNKKSVARVLTALNEATGERK